MNAIALLQSAAPSGAPKCSAKKAEAACPVSNALRNNLQITVDAAIAQGA